jgi:hypothetical protein
MKFTSSKGEEKHTGCVLGFVGVRGRLLAPSLVVQGVERGVLGLQPEGWSCSAITGKVDDEECNFQGN